MTISIISKTDIVDGKLPNDYEIEETLPVDKVDRIKIENELRGMAIQKKNIKSSIASYNIHVSRIKKAESAEGAIADLTSIPVVIKLVIPEINFNTDSIIFNTND